VICDASPWSGKELETNIHSFQACVFSLKQGRGLKLFSHNYTDQFLVIRNYAKETCGHFARIA